MPEDPKLFRFYIWNGFTEVFQGSNDWVAVEQLIKNSNTFSAIDTQTGKQFLNTENPQWEPVTARRFPRC
jgi:hypothetical protein